MKLIKYGIGITCFLLFISFIASSQSIIRSSINCFGSSYVSSNVMYRQSAGQPSNTSCFNNGEQLRQGFQQPISSLVHPYDFKKSVSINLYPNPATAQTNLTVSCDIGKYKIIISDVIGNEIVVIESENTMNSIDCSDFFPGIYIVSVINGYNPLSTTKLVITK